jgi:hypothetical protein
LADCNSDGRPEALSVRRAVEPYRQIRTRTHKLIVWESKTQALYDHAPIPARNGTWWNPRRTRSSSATCANACAPE